MEMVSFFGILLALAVIVVGSLRSYSLIILSLVAALIVSVTGGVDLATGYGDYYMTGVGGFITSLFPLFLGGTLFGKMLEVSGVSTSLAKTIMKKMGSKQVVAAIFIATYLMSLGGVNTFVIIFTMYPMACSFFKTAGISRKLIPAAILGPAVAMQMLPGTPITQNVLPMEALGVTPMAAPITALICAVVVFALNLWYLHREAGKYIAAGEGFEDREGEQFDVDLDATGLPNPIIGLIPIAVVIVLLNVVKLPVWGALYSGVLLLAVMYFRRIGGFKKTMDAVTSAAGSSMSVMVTASIVGFSAIVTRVPGYAVIENFLEGSSFGNPYLFAFLAVAVIAAVTGSATGGMQFAVDAFAQRFLEMGGNPQSLARIIAISSLSFDSLPHNSAIVLTLNYCGVSHKGGYKHLFFTTVVATLIGSVISIVTASLGIL